MSRFTKSIAITLAAGAAFFFGAEGDAFAGDPDDAAEAAPPGPTPALAVWNQEVRSASVDGLRFALDDDALAISVEGAEAKRFDYDVRCEIAMGSPMARVYVPPMVVSEARAQGRLAVGEEMTIPLDLTAAAAENQQGRFAGAFDTLRVVLRRRGAPELSEPIAVLQIPRVAPTET